MVIFIYKMKNLIKKILREETELDGFDWIRSSDPEDTIIDFTESRMKEGKYHNQFKHLSNGEKATFFENIEYSMFNLDVELRDALDSYDSFLKTDNPEKMMSSLNNIEGMYLIDDMVNEIKKGIQFFKPLMEETNYPLEKMLDRAIKYYRYGK